MPGQPIRVFISYSHDSEAHAAKVLGLANSLRTQGIDAWIDQYESAPGEGWPRWMQEQLERAQFVLLVCTPTYKRRFEGQETPGRGKGVTWEGLLVQVMLYDAGTRNKKFIPVLLDAEDEEARPLVLRPFKHYHVPREFDGLYRHLTNQPLAVPPELGPMRVMPPRNGAEHGPQVAASDAPSPSPHLAPMPARSTGMREQPALVLSQGQQDRLVELLLQCKAILRQETRERIVSRLGPITPYIARSNAPKLDTASIVETCADRDYGIELLVEAVRWAEGDTRQMRAIDEFVKSVRNA